MSMGKRIFLGALLLTLTACAGVDVRDYAAGKPVLDLATYFNGTVDGWGMFQDRSARW